MDIKSYLKERCKLVDEALDHVLPVADELPSSCTNPCVIQYLPAGKGYAQF